jgi:hypothetical protein
VEGSFWGIVAVDEEGMIVLGWMVLILHCILAMNQEPLISDRSQQQPKLTISKILHRILDKSNLWSAEILDVGT